MELLRRGTGRSNAVKGIAGYERDKWENSSRAWYTKKIPGGQLIPALPVDDHLIKNILFDPSYLVQFAVLAQLECDLVTKNRRCLENSIIKL